MTFLFSSHFRGGRVILVSVVIGQWLLKVKTSLAKNVSIRIYERHGVNCTNVDVCVR